MRYKLYCVNTSGCALFALTHTFAEKPGGVVAIEITASSPERIKCGFGAVIHSEVVGGRDSRVVAAYLGAIGLCEI